MKDYKKSDYAINKYSENIVYRFSNRIIQITLKDYLAENPDKSEEDFRELKRLSDEIYHQQVKDENSKTRLNSPLEYFENSVIDSQNLLEDKYIEKLDKYYSITALKALLKSGELTKIQKQRFIKYILRGYSLRQIAAQEKRAYSSIRESICACIKKLKKFMK